MALHPDFARSPYAIPPPVLRGWSNKLIWGDNKLIPSSLKAGALRQQIEDAGGLKLITLGKSSLPTSPTASLPGTMAFPLGSMPNAVD